MAFDLSLGALRALRLKVVKLKMAHFDPASQKMTQALVPFPRDTLVQSRARYAARATRPCRPQKRFLRSDASGSTSALGSQDAPCALLLSAPWQPGSLQLSLQRAIPWIEIRPEALR